MGSVPAGSMLSNGRVWMCGELGLKISVLGRSNRGLRTGRRAGAEVRAAALFGQPAFEAAGADGEGAENLLAWHATRDGCQHSFPEIKRITMHERQYPTRSGFMPTAV